MPHSGRRTFIDVKTIPNLRHLVLRTVSSQNKGSYLLLSVSILKLGASVLDWLALSVRAVSGKCSQLHTDQEQLSQPDRIRAHLDDEQHGEQQLRRRCNTDYLTREGSCGETEGTWANNGSSEMNRKNDSSQVKGLLCQNSDEKGAACRGRASSDSGGEEPSKPSTSRSTPERKRARPKSEEASGGLDDASFGKSCALYELKSLPGCRLQLEPLEYNAVHSVLVDVHEFAADKTLVAVKGRKTWDSHSVRMPYMEENTMTKTGLLWDGKQSRWETIEKYLTHLMKVSPLTTEEVEKTIRKYNPKYKDEWTFQALHVFFEFLSSDERRAHTHILRRMAELALRLPTYCPKSVPLLRRGQSHSLTLSQTQIACLLANAFFCTFPHRNSTHPRAEFANYPTINFSSLFSKWTDRKMHKFRAIFHYFDVVAREGSEAPSGLVTFSRRHIPESSFPKWRSCQETLTKLHVSSEGKIEKNGVGMLQVDFACNMVGGGVLAEGLVQEEILFLINPELMAARLFTEKLGDNECLRITGSQQYSEYSGYSDNFRWTGPHQDRTERDEWKRRYREIVAIDALNFKHPREQFNMSKVNRELNKAFCGFRDNTFSDYLPAVATGNWGCGAFHGDPKLKALIQMMAAAVAQRDMAYFTFKDSHLEYDLCKIHHFLTKHQVTVGRLYGMLENFCSALCRGDAKIPELYSFIMKSSKDTTSKQQAVDQENTGERELLLCGTVKTFCRKASAAVRLRLAQKHHLGALSANQRKGERKYLEKQKHHF
ncbi:hypothetical protein GJAV_G00038700 [Gymnothorax javanicus]|nr:hypothetical protein GJAV_G00038700 [Gymnothorax javanicus]